MVNHSEFSYSRKKKSSSARLLLLFDKNEFVIWAAVSRAKSLCDNDSAVHGLLIVKQITLNAFRVKCFTEREIFFCSECVTPSL